MYRMKTSAFFLVFIFACIFTQAQTNLDSLWGVWNNELAPDTSRALAMHTIAWEGYLFSQPDSAFYFAQMQYDFAKSKNIKKEMGNALNTQGVSFYIRSDYEKALEYYKKSLLIREEISDKRGMAASCINLGMIYRIQGHYPKAIEYYQRCLQINEDIKDNKLTSSVLQSIGKIHMIQGDYPKAIAYYNQSLQLMEEYSDKRGIGSILNNFGSIYMNQGNYSRALDYYQRSFQISEELSDKRGMASGLNNIGLIYMNRKDFSKAQEYYQRSYEIKKGLSDKNGMAITLNNIGLVYQKQEDYTRALSSYHQSLEIREEISDQRGMAGVLNNIGEVYMDQGNHQVALDYYQRSLKINEKISDKRAVAITMINIGKINNYKGDYAQAINWCEKALKASEEINIYEMQKNSCQCLYTAHKGLGNNYKALNYYERINMLNDSLQAKETTKKLQQMEFDRQMLKDSLLNEKEKINIQIAHEDEVRKKNRTRNIILLIAFFLLILAIGIYRRVLFIRKAKRLIEKEKNRSDKLLLNILPSDVADELKEKGRADARKFEQVTILFTDFRNFTKIAEKLTAEVLVDEINSCFEEFDKICGKYGIEKIKTIGDAYMAAGGLPLPSTDSVRNTVRAAIEMATFIKNRKELEKSEDNPRFEMRVGIHTGPVVAGIVGHTKFQYDIWGDAVNTASRMESSGEVGKVNISQSTFDIIRNDPTFKFQSRGEIKAKGKGDIQMWFVDNV